MNLCIVFTTFKSDTNEYIVTCTINIGFEIYKEGYKENNPIALVQDLTIKDKNIVQINYPVTHSMGNKQFSETLSRNPIEKTND